MARDRLLVFALTFVVALCSIVYELIYSELLTVVFGGRAMRYAITIGLFLFFLGIGAFAFRDLEDPRENFFRVEIYLALAGPAGLLYIVFLNAIPGVDLDAPRVAMLVASHLPVVVVGFLSGLEIPLLTALLESTGEDDLGPAVRRAVRRARTGVRGVLGWLFVVDTEPGDGDPDAFSAVLGMDYFGSLVGTVVYALWFYPELGLIPTVFVLGLLNALAALAFGLRFGEARTLRLGRAGESASGATDGGRPAGGGGTAGDAGAAGGGGDRPTGSDRTLTVRVGGGSAALTAALLLVTALYAGVVVNGEAVEQTVTETYLEARMESEYPGEQMEMEVTSHFTTTYQDVTLYDRTWTGGQRSWASPGQTTTCMRLDTQVQVCENWVEGYHRGLVDVPAGLYEDLAGKDVLLVGGGDFIAVDHLREYGADVRQVDIDAEFMAYARNSSFLRQYHDDAYRYDRLNTTVGDAFTFLQETNETYDLVLLDVPGARNDDMLGLYSVEFYELLRSHLTPDGVVATWVYERHAFSRHHKAYVNTVGAAGFSHYAAYSARDDLNGDGSRERVERFYVLSPDAERTRPLVDRERSLRWNELPRYRGVEPNSIFHPNYDILVRN